MKMELEVKEVLSGKELKDFLNLPDAIYFDNEKYVRPLDLHMKMMIGKLGGKKKHLFLAYEGGKPVARLGAKVHNHNGKETLNFGFFESLPDKVDAVKALFEKAQSLYPHLKVMGPFHFRMEDPYIGVLAEGYEKEPYFLMPYNPPYYLKLLEEAQLSKVMDLFTYEVHAHHPLGDVIHENVKKARESGVTIRTLNPKKLKEEARNIARIFNDALSKNWGFEEFLDEQVNEMFMLLKLFIDPRVVIFAQKDGKDVGCLLMIPNYNPIIKGTKGKITPGLVWRYFRRRSLVNTIRGYALGVLRDYHGFGIGSALTEELFKIGREIGYNYGEISWVLANNGPMNELSAAMGGKHNKVYRVFEKAPLRTV